MSGSILQGYSWSTHAGGTPAGVLTRGYALEGRRARGRPLGVLLADALEREARELEVLPLPCSGGTA
jgi:hypothetical protein